MSLLVEEVLWTRHARGLVGWTALPLALAALVLLCHPCTGEVWHEGAIEETGSWSDEVWGGEAYTMEYSHDGSMVMLVGYGGPDEVRILDRDMGLLGRWEPGEPNVTVDGAAWSLSDQLVAVWCGKGEGVNDTLLIMSVPTFEPSGVPNLTNNNTLTDITSARLVAGDSILALAGRTDEGHSRLQFLEVGTSHLVNDIAWKENAAIVSIHSDGIYVLVVDEKGFLGSVETRSWTLEMRWEGAGAPPSATCIGLFAQDRICIVGYEDGAVRTWEGHPRVLNGEAGTGEGPVQGVASLFSAPRYYAVAVPRDGGGSTIAGWIHNESWGDKEWSNIVPASASVLSMGADPQVAGQFLAAFDDGSIWSYRTTIIVDQPPVIDVILPPRSSEWRGVVNVRGEVLDEMDRVEWVRYSVDGGVWMEAEGTSNFTFDVDVDGLQPAIHSIAIKAFDGVHESQIIYDFHIPGPREDDEGENFWLWFTGCTSMVVALAIVAFFVLRGRGEQQPSKEAVKGATDSVDDARTEE